MAVEVSNPIFEQHTALAWVRSTVFGPWLTMHVHHLLCKHRMMHCHLQVSTSGTADQLVVLGTATGDVKAHSTSSGKLVWRATAVSEG